jgi:hypothetical protein
MINNKLAFFLCVFLFFFYTVQGQNYAFKVLANKGSNEFRSGDAWQPIKTGATLKESDEIRLVENSYLGLVSSSGKAMELKKPGLVKVSELSKELSGGSSVVQKYTDFLLSSNSAEAKKNRLSATGAVHRDISAPLHLVLPENQHSAIYNSNAVISWEATKVQGPYILTLRNMFDDILDRYETSESSYKVDFSRFAKENAIIVQVHSKNDTKEVSKQHLIKKLSASENENIRKSLDQIAPELSEPTALNKLILAGFYEENRLLIDAITAYEEAVKLAPDVPSYSEAYEEFLLRNSISR